ncbi:hypothetical protein WAE60_13320 [Caulobacter sp. CCG-8]|uniref:hypothetical protein n=1 Tax=Caulobacter sp. UNC358MFTsu5.1 TaxID=1449049 RepID=UPI001E2DAFEF|nr:hypothetical protein [Caulobacter sp. UNC358MFTsu5.1]
MKLGELHPGVINRDDFALVVQDRNIRGNGVEYGFVQAKRGPFAHLVSRMHFGI